MVKKSALLFCVLISLAFFGTAYGLGLKGKLDNRVSAPREYAGADSVTNNGRSVLPKKGDIGVIVEGSNAQHIRTAEAAIIEMLVSHGYRVVDEAKMKRMRAAAAKAKAARYALEGNVEAILKLNASYSAAATVVARVEAGKPVLNEFQLYTCTSSAAIMAVTSRATKLGGKTAQGKEIGYTEEEAMQKAIDSAVAMGMSQMF